MTNRWDDFSKSLAEESSTRRESLRLLGAALAGAVLSPLGLGTARGAGKPRAADPCKTICRCSNKRQQDACLAACRSCTGATSRLCGSCGTGVNCYDLAHDVNNCGACGNACLPGPYETAACLAGTCVYSCVEGAVALQRRVHVPRTRTPTTAAPAATSATTRPRTAMREHARVSSAPQV